MRSHQIIDRSRAEALQDDLVAVRYRGNGTVALLVEKPAPRAHAVREQVEVVAGRGFVGDHARKSFWRGVEQPGREVSAIALEVLCVLGANPSAIGDNLITEGVDLRALRPGDRLRVGEVILERSAAPHRPCDLFRDRTSPEAFSAVAQGDFRGALFTVVQGGVMRTGDAIRVLKGELKGVDV